MTLPSPREASPRGGAGHFTAIRRVRSFDAVVAQIQGAIASGHFRAGDRLPTERELCALFDVSRPTVREALRALEALGSLEIRPGKRGGIVVASPSGDGVGTALAALIALHGATPAELNEFRVSFESTTAAWAAERADTSEIAAVLAVAAEARDASQVPDTEWPAMVAIDLTFHEAVAVASHNRVREAVMLGLVRAVQRVEFTIESIANDELLRSVGDELTAIAEAIAARDAERASDSMRRHVERFGAMYVDAHHRAATPAVASLGEARS